MVKWSTSNWIQKILNLGACAPAVVLLANGLVVNFGLEWGGMCCETVADLVNQGTHLMHHFWVK